MCDCLTHILHSLLILHLDPFLQALCLYDYMKDYAGSSLFVLFKAIKFQVMTLFEDFAAMGVFVTFSEDSPMIMFPSNVCICDFYIGRTINRVFCPSCSGNPSNVYLEIHQLDFLQSFRSEITALSDL